MDRKKIILHLTTIFFLLIVLQSANAATVSLVVNNYGNVFPTLTESNLNTFITSAPAPWYVSFNLLTQANVKLGTLSLTQSNNGSSFNVTDIRLVTEQGANVAFGTDTFINSFPSTIDRLVVTNALPAGAYALEVSGVGNRTGFGLGGTFDASDFIVRLQITPVPLPAAAWLFGAGLISLLGVSKKKSNIVQYN